MAKFRLAANAEVDLLTRDELDGTLRDRFNPDAWVTARGSGIKYLEQTFTFGTPVTIGPNNGVVLVDNAGNGTPRAGYAWAVRSLAFILGAGAIGQAWKISDPTDATPSSYIRCLFRGTSNPTQQAPFSSLQFVLKAGEFCALNTQGASTLISAWLAVVETPEAELWKVE